MHLCSILAAAMLLAGCGDVSAPETVERERIHVPDLAYVNEDDMQYVLKDVKLIERPRRVYADGSVSSYKRHILATVFEVSNLSDQSKWVWNTDEHKKGRNRREIFLLALKNAHVPLVEYQVIDQARLWKTECPSKHMDQRLVSFDDVWLYSGDTVTAALCWHNKKEIRLDNYDVFLTQAVNGLNIDFLLRYQYPWEAFILSDDMYASRISREAPQPPAEPIRRPSRSGPDQQPHPAG